MSGDAPTVIDCPRSLSMYPEGSRYAAIEARDERLLRELYPHLSLRRVSLMLEGPTPSFFDDLQQSPARGRRGEVVMVIRHGDGRIWLHTKRFYPPGAYRLPSGGIREDEPALAAARRECREEAGVELEVTSCLGILHYALERGDERAAFISYVFVYEGNWLHPVPEDSLEAISDYRLIWPGGLPAVARSLRGLAGRWQDWGRFRAVAHEFVYQQGLTSI